ncbi:MAG: pantoate--beta-alanine ligase [Phycisphaerales bacterium]|nr:MAG: pantoate--beta-alanine ligase [Phycisphaerales bacterium]
MRILTDADQLHELRGCVLTPTMGGLHAGHAALVRHARALADERGTSVVVSLFVNPTQFDNPADFARYPRTLDADSALCAAAGADAVFAPPVAVVYPAAAPVPAPPPPAQALGRGLEDAFRPGHFEGVCQVVRRIFDLVSPAAAVFGEKDWQQLQVVRAMTARDLPGIEIIGSPTVREPDGLAMSSRNRFLTPDERARAAGVARALCDACGAPSVHEAERAMRRTLGAAGMTIDYAVVRDAATLEPVDPTTAPGGAGQMRALVAAHLGSVRLLDNAPWPA